MTSSFARNACPRLDAPMETGDGLLARIVPAGPVPIDAFAALCAAAQTFGNGLMEVSARGSLQVRGLTPQSAPLFARAATALGVDAGYGPPVLATPLPDDPTALIDAHAVAAEIRRDVAARKFVLAPKVSVIVDGGGRIHCDALPADIRLQAIAAADAPRLFVSVAGDAASSVPLGMVALPDAAAAVADLLGVVAAHGPMARASDVLRSEGLGAFTAAAGGRLEAPVPPATRGPVQTIGLHGLRDGRCAVGVALPFGQAHALDLIALMRIASANGAAWVATAPARTLLLGPIGEMTGFALATAADTLGFVVDARDSRRRVVACPGAPACASGLIPARALAAEIARGLPASEDGIAVHVSGCAKGCAHPAAAPLAVVGTVKGCGIVQDGTARSRPDRTVALREAVREAVREALSAQERSDA
jgi:precorrin-3B synthase